MIQHSQIQEADRHPPKTHTHDAAQVTNTPAGNIAATDVQAAINELDTEKMTIGDVIDGGTFI